MIRTMLGRSGRRRNDESQPATSRAMLAKSRIESSVNPLVTFLVCLSRCLDRNLVPRAALPRSLEEARSAFIESYDTATRERSFP